MEYERKVKLKDGRPCLLRNATEQDTEAVLANFAKAHEETDFLLSYPDEDHFSSADEAAFLKSKQESLREVEICAVLEGRIVGLAGIDSIGTREKIRHRADLGIHIEKEFWSLGIGRALVCACIECAEKAGYTQLELTAVADNERAVSLYKSLGFAEYGRNPKGFKSRYTGWQEIVLMRLELG